MTCSTAAAFVPPGGSRPVQNAGNRNYGRVTLQQATTNSINTAYVDLETNMKDGPAKTLEFAQKVGLPKAGGGWDPVSVLPLGIPEVSPLSHASGYATFANGGKHAPAHVVAQVKDATGAVLYRANTKAEQVIDADVANRRRGRAHPCGAGRHRCSRFRDGVPDRRGRPAPITTGPQGGAATQACWFVGMSKQIATAVMFVAGKDGTADLDKVRPRFFGGGPPLSTWMAYMQVAQKGLKDVPFDQATRRTSTQTPTLPPQPTRTATPTPTRTLTADPHPDTDGHGHPTGRPTGRPTSRPTTTR